MLNAITRTPKQLGASLRRRRKALGLSQTEVASRINLRQATISDIEAGERDARVSTLMDVLAALDLELVVRPRRKSSVEDLESAF